MQDFFLKRRHTRLRRISSYCVAIPSMNVAKISKSLRVITIILTYVYKISTCTNFRQVIKVTKIKPAENLIDERLYRRKFPDLRYMYLDGTHPYFSVDDLENLKGGATQ